MTRATNILFGNLTDEELLRHADSFSVHLSRLEEELATRLKEKILQRERDRQSLQKMAEIIKNTDLLMSKPQGQ